jgi:nucleoside-diphosphate-sugar epimerase
VKKPVVVTGASGFLGSYLVAELASRGEEVVATSRRRPKFLDGLPEVRFVSADLREGSEKLRPALEGASRVYHCGALFDFWATAAELWRVNVTGTERLIKAMQDAGVPELVNISSASVYGKHYQNHLCIETDPPAPADKYARSKWGQEGVVAARTNPDKLRVVSLRPGAIYGPGSHYGDAIALYLLKKGLLFCVPGLTKIVSSHVHVKDVCRAAIYLGDTALSDGADPIRLAFNVCDSTPTFNEVLLRSVAELIPEKGLIGFWKHIRIPGFSLYFAAWLAELIAVVTRTRPLFEAASIHYITCGHGASNAKLLGSGYKFLYPSLVDGLTETVRWYEATNWRVFEDLDLLYTCLKRA